LSWAVCFTVFLQLIFRVITWSHSYFTVTPDRAISITGFMSLKVDALPLSEIKIAQSSRRFIRGRKQSYGKCSLTPKEEPHPEVVVDFVPDLQEVFEELNVLRIYADRRASAEAKLRAESLPSYRRTRPLKWW
jgi:hypothetical protein